MFKKEETMKNIRKNDEHQKQYFFLDFSINPGGSGGHPGGSRTDSGAEKVWKNCFFKNGLRSKQITPYLGDPKFDIKNIFFMKETSKNNKNER